MSDSPFARQELIAALGVSDQCILESPAEQRQANGYDQGEFNRKSDAERRMEIIRLIAEIEIARNSQHFIGTSTSNLFCLLRLLRVDDGRGMVAVEAV